MSLENLRSELFNIDRCTELLTRLVEIDTCQPEGQEARLVDFIEGLYRNSQVECRRIEHGEQRASLVVRLKADSEKGAVAFVGHLDTVAVGSPGLWNSPPLKATIRDGKLFARGAADMKGGIAAMLLALDYIIEKNQNLRKSVLFCFTADEEKEGKGARALADSGLLKDVGEMIICEPSGEALGLCEKGALWVRVQANGVSSHASRPELGVNALEALISFATKARSLIDPAQNHPLLGKNSLSVTNLHGGIMTNVVPSSASIELDIRTLPGVSHEDIRLGLGKLCRELEAAMSPLELILEIINNRPPLGMEETNDFILKIQASAEKHGIKLEKKGLFFYTDASQLVPGLGAPFVILGPGDDRQAHKTNEHIELESVARFARIYAGYIEDYCL